MNKRGSGNYQYKMKLESRNKIIHALTDGDRHQYSEILEQTKISPPILAKHLKELKKDHLIEKQEDENDFRKVYYKATPFLMEIFLQLELTNSSWEDIKNEYFEKKDLSLAIKRIGYFANVFMLKALEFLNNAESHSIKSDTLQTFLELFLWESYNSITLKFVNFCLENKILETTNFLEVTKKVLETE